MTARTQGKARWFTEELRDQIAEYICEAAASSSSRLLAYAVMPNHLHVVARQGVQPLGWMMQRILQRTALLIRRTYDHRDHVFGRRYWSGLCHDAAYLRQAIIYTHLNPFYAGLCHQPRDYQWTSHQPYEDRSLLHLSRERVAVEHGLRLFASTTFDDSAIRADYMRFVTFWMQRERLPLGAKYVISDLETSSAPRAPGGDMFWVAEYGDVVAEPSSCARGYGDLRDRAIAVLRKLADDLSLEQLRHCGRSKPASRVRRELIATLLIAGYRNGAIARCLNVSNALVSSVGAAIRMAHVRGNHDSGSGLS